MRWQCILLILTCSTDFARIQVLSYVLLALNFPFSFVWELCISVYQFHSFFSHPWLFLARALELFIESLIIKASETTRAKHAKTLSSSHMWATSHVHFPLSSQFVSIQEFLRFLLTESRQSLQRNNLTSSRTWWPTFQMSHHQRRTLRHHPLRYPPESGHQVLPLWLHPPQGPDLGEDRARSLRKEKSPRSLKSVAASPNQPKWKLRPLRQQIQAFHPRAVTKKRRTAAEHASAQITPTSAAATATAISPRIHSASQHHQLTPPPLPPAPPSNLTPPSITCRRILHFYPWHLRHIWGLDRAQAFQLQPPTPWWCPVLLRLPPEPWTSAKVPPSPKGPIGAWCLGLPCLQACPPSHPLPLCLVSPNTWVCPKCCLNPPICRYLGCPELQCKYH